MYRTGPFVLIQRYFSQKYCRVYSLGWIKNTPPPEKKSKLYFSHHNMIPIVSLNTSNIYPTLIIIPLYKLGVWRTLIFRFTLLPDFPKSDSPGTELSTSSDIPHRLFLRLFPITGQLSRREFGSRHDC